jgi:hypothetical protein
MSEERTPERRRDIGTEARESRRLQRWKRIARMDLDYDAEAAFAFELAALELEQVR